MRSMHNTTTIESTDNKQIITMTWRWNFPRSSICNCFYISFTSKRRGLIKYNMKIYMGTEVEQNPKAYAILLTQRAQHLFTCYINSLSSSTGNTLQTKCPQFTTSIRSINCTVRTIFITAVFLASSHGSAGNSAKEHVSDADWHHDVVRRNTRLYNTAPVALAIFIDYRGTQVLA